MTVTVESFLLLVGTVAVITGTAVLSWPAALIVVGALMVAAAVDMRREG